MDPTAGLYDQPVLVIDPGIHLTRINRASADAAGCWVATGSEDKTVRIWSLADGALQRTIRLPAGPGNVGKAYAVAISPDGALLAVGGWMRNTTAYPQEHIYLFDRSSGALVRQIKGLPRVVNYLVFSPDGRRLAATLNAGGLRIYARELDWSEIAIDTNYNAHSYGAAFAPDCCLATTSIDGLVRLYSGDLAGRLRPTAMIVTSAGHQPYGIAFSPDGTQLAVGYHDVPAVDLMSGSMFLAPLPRPDLRGLNTGNLMMVAWSRDGRTLFAGGRYAGTKGLEVLAWGDAGKGQRRTLTAALNTVMSLVPLPMGELVVASVEPSLSRFRTDGKARWMHAPPKADFREQFDKLSLSNDGTRVAFGFMSFGGIPARFDLLTRTLALDPPPDAEMATPCQQGLPIESWLNTTTPTLGGKPLPLQPHETSRSLAIHPSCDRFVLGTDWLLRALDTKGTLLWTRPAPGVVWAVNITSDGRLVIAAYADGTIRWHRMSDGVELLAFMPLPDRENWVAWTPEGYYAATAGAHGILRWHVNRGWDAADSIPIADIPGSFRPAVLPLVLQELETPRALGLAVLAEHNREIAIRTRSQVSPGTQLHLVTIGISAYNEEYAKNLRLAYADCDARDLASVLVNTQGSLYARMCPQVLLNKDANKGGILRALKTMRAGMSVGNGNDLAVVHFSGHGALVDGSLYLLPCEVDARDAVGIQTSALSADEMRNELLELSKHGRVLVLLDACHSGAAAMAGATLNMNSTALRMELAAANVTVLTSSSATEVSCEDPAWRHGAFTKVLLDALSDPAADSDRNGLIRPTGLARYLINHVHSLTGGKQTPGIVVRYDTTVFAIGM